MSPRILKLRALVTAVGATLLLAGSGAGQTLHTRNAPPPSPALALESQARTLMDQPKKWEELAELLAQAARIRPADDPRGVEDLIIAGAAYRWVGKRSPARATYVAAGERALGLGDVVRAADAFLSAAIIANEQKDLPAAWDLRGRADRLAESPLLTDDQRRLILGQFTVTARYAQRP